MSNLLLLSCAPPTNENIKEMLLTFNKRFVLPSGAGAYVKTPLQLLSCIILTTTFHDSIIVGGISWDYELNQVNIDSKFQALLMELKNILHDIVLPTDIQNILKMSGHFLNYCDSFSQ